MRRSSARVRVATVDIGTNAVLLLVAERGDDGVLRALAERATITRLGEGVDAARSLTPGAIARTNTCLSDYAAEVARWSVDGIAVVGTSAMRDARGGEQVRAHVARALGVEARTISGNEEAQLTFVGALRDRGTTSSPGAQAVVFDVGGGSTEVVAGTANPPELQVHVGRSFPPLRSGLRAQFAQSFDVGSVRLTERHLRSDPPSASELADLEAAANDAFRGLTGVSAEEPIGVAGTMTTLAAVSFGEAGVDGARVDGRVTTVEELRAVVARLRAMPLAQRRAVPGLHPMRADVIVAGGIITLAVLTRLGATRCRVSDRGVRWGLAYELADSLADARTV